MSIEQGRERMINDIENEVVCTHKMIGREQLDIRVMTAMRDVPREKFVSPELKNSAFNNSPLPIGYKQTISQPYIVALMTDLLEIQSGDKILEIGTGSGYQTAILSLLCDQVYSIEVIPELSITAQQRLSLLGYRNVKTRIGNGCLGWPENGPYDGIIVTAAASIIPSALIEQLRPGGRLVIPIGRPYGYQELVLLEKDQTGHNHLRSILDVAFVPLMEFDAISESAMH